MAPLLILFTERKFLLTHYYDPNKVDISSITIDDRQNIIPGVNLRYSLSIPFKNRMEGIIVTVILMNPSEADSNISDRTVNKLIDFSIVIPMRKFK